jgi:hypothetical protein
MREGDAAQIAERLVSYNRTSSSEVPRFTRIGRNSEESLPKPAKQVPHPARHIVSPCSRQVCGSPYRYHGGCACSAEPKLNRTHCDVGISALLLLGTHVNFLVRSAMTCG